MHGSRRGFLKRSLLSVAATSAIPCLHRTARGAGGVGTPRVRALTKGPKHHFFGYYAICPWNHAGDLLGSLECERHDRMPLPGEAARIGVVDAATGRFEPLAETHAWNLQQGAMLHWNAAAGSNELFFNCQDGRRLLTAAIDVNSGQRRDLPGPLSGVAPDGRYALSLTYGRMGRLRKVVGYAGAADPNPTDPAPTNDGVFLVDLRNGTRELVVSIADVYHRLLPLFPSLRGRHMWFNHTAFNRSGDRFAFFARAYLPPGNKRHTAMFTADRDGGDLRQVVAFDKKPSHYDWRDDRQVLATFVLAGKERRHVLFTDGADDHRAVGGGRLAFDGHCAIAPDGDWVATDQKHTATTEQSLWVHNLATGEHRLVCRHDMREARYLSWNVRCDFHPRWDRRGRQVCFDAIEPGGATRQLHLYDHET